MGWDRVKSQDEVEAELGLDSAKKKTSGIYERSSTDILKLLDFAGVDGMAKNALSCVDRWLYTEGRENLDTDLKLWVKEDVLPLFTANIHNRILSKLRNKFGRVVLVKYYIKNKNGKIKEVEQD